MIYGNSDWYKNKYDIDAPDLPDTSFHLGGRPYGDMVGCHQQIADLWNAFLSDKLKEALGAQDVAMLMALLKIARLRVSPEHRDSVIDLAGYTAIYGAIIERFHND